MTKEQALDYIHKNPQHYLQKARSEGFICPICGSGNGPNGTGIIRGTKNPAKFTCFAGGCFTGADIPDIIAIKEGLEPGSREALRRAYEVYGLAVDNLPTGQLAAANQQAKPQANEPTKGNPTKKEARTDYTQDFEEWHKHIGETTYPQQRGLNEDTISRFQLGYNTNFETYEDRDGTRVYGIIWKALIIPNGPYNFIARNTSAEAEHKNRYRFSPGPRPFFNLAALEQDTEPVFIVEGEIDAISIAQVGGTAIAIQTNWQGFLQIIEGIRRIPPLVLALDKDEKGKDAEKSLAAGLRERGIAFTQVDLTGEYDDANARLIKQPAWLEEAVAMTRHSLRARKQEAQETEQAAYFQRAGVNLDAFFQETAQRVKPFPTGLPVLDSELDGGLLTELTIIGGGTSTGKTTLAMQIVENIAKAGNNVLVISLETGKNELIARSLSRGTLEQCNKAGIPTNSALTAKQLIKGETGEEVGILEAASEALRAYKENLFIISSLGKIGVKRIKEELEANIRYTGKTPVVLIDYLQLLGTDGQTTGIRETMDEAITGLKKLAVDFKTPVIAISSISRGQYGQDANLSSFKESGGIEYSGDLLLGLQYAGAEGKKQAELEKLANKEPRKMELKILKQRLGNIGTRITLDYMQKYNFFTETGAERPR
jgi:replicative DNA helicase